MVNHLVLKMDAKICYKCKKLKWEDEFSLSKTRLDGKQAKCKSCVSIYTKTDKQRRFDRERGKQSFRKRQQFTGMLKFSFNITFEIFSKMIIDQSGLCKSCGNKLINKKEPHIDHDHKSNNIRGLLCGGCNVALGYLRESADKCYKLGKYIEENCKNSN